MTAPNDFLLQMAQSSRERVAAAKRNCSEAALLARAVFSERPPALRRSNAGFDLIAELKLRSPAGGVLRPASEDVAMRVCSYAEAGAAAVSVLTEPTRFDGTMAHLEAAAEVLRPLGVPVMRKDFLVDPYQVVEARIAGAGGVLVIVRMLSRAQLRELLDCAHLQDLFVLLEAFDRTDIEAMHEVLSMRDDMAQDPPVLVGLNCRDLTTLQTVPERLFELCSLLPDTLPRVAESGVGTAADAARVAEAGYQFALVGSALMQSQNPGALATQMLDAGRGVISSGRARS